MGKNDDYQWLFRKAPAMATAFDEGRMEEVEAVFTAGGDVIEEDTGLRRDSSMEKLAKLKPVFDRRVGNVTPGNSSQITDGAAVLLMLAALLFA